MKTNGSFSILIFSSLVFITNVFSTFYKKYYFYCFLFVCLTITSVIFHYNTNIYTNLLDRIFVLAIVFYGGCMLYNKTTTNNQLRVLLIVITFLCCIFFFFYGYYVNDYCYNPDKRIGDIYHCMLHIIASFGNHLLTFL